MFHRASGPRRCSIWGSRDRNAKSICCVEPVSGVEPVGPFMTSSDLAETSAGLAPNKADSPSTSMINSISSLQFPCAEARTHRMHPGQAFGRWLGKSGQMKGRGPRLEARFFRHFQILPVRQDFQNHVLQGLKDYSREPPKLVVLVSARLKGAGNATNGSSNDRRSVHQEYGCTFNAVTMASSCSVRPRLNCKNSRG